MGLNPALVYNYHNPCRPRNLRKTYFAVYRYGDGPAAVFVAWTIGVQPDNRTAINAAYRAAKNGGVTLLVCSPQEAERKLDELGDRYFENLK